MTTKRARENGAGLPLNVDAEAIEELLLADRSVMACVVYVNKCGGGAPKLCAEIVKAPYCEAGEAYFEAIVKDAVFPAECAAAVTFCRDLFYNDGKRKIAMTAGQCYDAYRSRMITEAVSGTKEEEAV